MKRLRLAVFGLALIAVAPGRSPSTTPADDAKAPDGAKRAAPATAKRIDHDACGRLVGLGDPQFHPDGRSIAFVVRRQNFDKNRYDSEIVLLDLAGRRQRVLTHDRAFVGQPRWSPTGDRLAFLATAGTGKDVRVQLFVMPMAGGDARRVTDAPEGVSDFAWKPDGSAFAFSARDEGDKKAIEKWDDAFEVGNNDYLASEAPRPVHAWLVPAAGGPARRLTSGTWSLTMNPPPNSPSSPLQWTPDGTSLLIVRQERPHDGDNEKTAVQVLDVATGAARPLTGKKELESNPTISPDGSRVAYSYPRDGDWNNQPEIYTAPASGGPGRNLTRGVDRTFYQAAWMPDGRSVILGGNDGTGVSLWQQPLDGPARRLDLGKVCPAWSYSVDLNVSRQGAIAFTGSEPHRPTELYYLANPDSTPERLTDFNGEVAGLDLGRVDTIEWATHDGFKANGVLTFPPGYEKGKKYPLVLLIHGGPVAASTARFGALAQLFASHGYVIFSPNYRGSDNLGNAYVRAIYKDWGDGPGKDVMAGVEAVKKLGCVDEGRMAVSGWSYGGYMTTWLIGHYHCWKAAVAGAAVTNWHDHYNLSDGNEQHRYLFGGSLWSGDREKLFREQSPITYAKEMRTPTLILATTGDARVPVTQSYQLYHALKDHGVPVKFIAYPVGGHYPGDPVRGLDVGKRWLAWLDERLK